MPFVYKSQCWCLCVPLLALGLLYCLTAGRGPVTVSFGKVPNCVRHKFTSCNCKNTQHKPDTQLHTTAVVCSLELVVISTLEDHQPVPQPIRQCTW